MLSKSSDDGEQTHNMSRRSSGASSFEQKFANKITTVKRDGTFSATSQSSTQRSTTSDIQSKKPRRRVDYKPYSVSDYEAMQERIRNQGVARLGPDLENERTKAAREHREKMMEYSKTVGQVHKQAGLPQRPKRDKKMVYAVVDGKGTWQQSQDAAMKRVKAKEYADTHVPRPVPARRTMTKPTFAFGSTQRARTLDDTDSPQRISRARDGLGDSDSGSGRLGLDGQEDVSLAALEQRHEAELAAVDDIMAEFS
ncbi:Protein of unknown function DUF4591 [Carpediemonas membranifera]|uniref:Uncharacterized protein n=1 Tax=Carpediemonas membranifera TaxID=201153 RepID=A0A8J6E8D8_9EUKA|nr:Protein of unknown function DUF4591 [Carpediemonas membranifera]|eukprot:KAG9391765.1 Protein of unknown function DUF4591 [Carpediemonas membranifera]